MLCLSFIWYVDCYFVFVFASLQAVLVLCQGVPGNTGLPGIFILLVLAM